MRILLVPSAYLPSVGGVELNTHELARRLREMGHEVMVLTSNWRRWNLPLYERIADINVFRLPFYLFRGTLKSFLAFILCFPVAFLGTCLLIKIFRPDVINIHFLGTNALFIMLADYLIKVPLVITFHGNEVINIPDITKMYEKGYTKNEVVWMKAVIQRLLGRADHVTAVSNDLLSFASGQRHDIQIKSTRIFVGGFDLQNSSVLATRCWGRAPFILAVGRLAVEKGFDWLLDAFKEISGKYMNLSLIIIGEGSERNLLLEKIDELQLKERVVLQGALPKEEIRGYYENCLFLVVSSRWEGLGTVILEAFSFGKPVVASAVGAIPEIVTEGVTGLLVEKENVGEMADAIEKLLSNTPLREKLGANGRTFMQETGGWQKSAEKYYEIYKRVSTST